jgi:hypothetical protein
MIEIRWGHKYTNNLKDEIESKIINIGYKTKTFIGQSDFFSIDKEYSNSGTGQVNFAKSLFTSGRWYRQMKYLKENAPEQFTAIVSCSLGAIFMIVLAILAKIYF